MLASLANLWIKKSMLVSEPPCFHPLSDRYLALSICHEAIVITTNQANYA